MEATIKELKEYRQYWEDQLVNLARLPRHKSKELQEVRDGRIEFAIERVRDLHDLINRRELEAEVMRKANRLEDQAWRDVIPEPHY